MLPPSSKPRSVKQVEMYLDRLAAVARRANKEELQRLLPLISRLSSELEAARSEEELLKALLMRTPPPPHTTIEKEPSE